MTRPDWPEPNNPKSDPNRHEKELNRFWPKIQNWTDPKPNRLETVMIWIDPKFDITQIESELTWNLIDPIWLVTRNEPNQIRIDANAY